GLQDVGFAAEERLADFELFRVGGDHFLDGNGLTRIDGARFVHDAEPAGGERLFQPVLAGDDLPNPGRSRRTAELAEDSARRMQRPKDGVRADVEFLILFGLRGCRRGSGNKVITALGTARGIFQDGRVADWTINAWNRRREDVRTLAFDRL